VRNPKGIIDAMRQKQRRSVALKNIMRTILLSVLVFFGSLWLYGQKNDSTPEHHVLKHFFSVNPLNALLFQQAGITYEFKPGIIGCGLTGGYIYPNRQEYSNYFIAGPTNYSSLGFYSGSYIVPQLNFYFKKSEKKGRTKLLYIALKAVYKYMTVDSTETIVWYTQGGSSNGNSTNKKMDDTLNIYGAFIDFGFKYVNQAFFVDLNIGPGIMCLNHNMITYGISYGSSSVHYINPPQQEVREETHVTINFTLNLGISF